MSDKHESTVQARHSKGLIHSLNREVANNDRDFSLRHHLTSDLRRSQFGSAFHLSDPLEIFRFRTITHQG